MINQKKIAWEKYSIRSIEFSLAIKSFSSYLESPNSFCCSKIICIENLSHSTLLEELGAYFDVRNEIIAIHISERRAAVFGFKQFVKSIEELWYPSSDDVLFCQFGCEYFAHIDHEEFISIYST
jgi:hypothetical protein